MRIPFITYAKLWVVIGALVVAASVVAVAVWQLKPGIDFTGGSLMEITFSQNRPDVSALAQVLVKNQVTDPVLQNSGDAGFIIRSGNLDETQHQQVLAALKKTFEIQDTKLREERFETIGPAISSQLKQRSIWGVILVNISIILYLAYAFRRVARPVSSWIYGLLAIVALFHDVLIVLGVFAVLGHFRGVEVDTAFVVAVLTVLGFSVNDTIVVYDRIRENLLRRTATDFATMVNNGLNDTLARSLNTTFTAVLPLLALFFFGGATVHYFVLALLVGMVSGAYSSIFIASPLLVLIEQWQRSRRATA